MGGLYLGNNTSTPIDLTPLKTHTHNNIPLSIKLASSGTTNIGKYKKFATIDCSTPWKDFEGTFIFYEAEANSFYGILQVFCRTSSTIDVHTHDLKWLALSDKKYEMSVYSEKVDDGYINLYVRGMRDYQSTKIICLTANDNIELIQGSWIDSITAYRSSLISGYVAASADATKLNGQDASYYETIWEYL